jgi:hypothetical protein
MGAKKGTQGAGRRRRPWNEIFLGVSSALVFAAAIFADVTDVIAGALILAGLVLAFLAAFWSRISGPVGLTKDGLTASIDRAEQQAELGQSHPISWEPGPLGGSIIGGGIPGQTAMPPPEYAREVRMVPEALMGLVGLSEEDRNRVFLQVLMMRTPDFHVEADPVITGGDEGRSYRVRTVPDTDLRLWYRPLSEEEPDTLVVMVIERAASPG